MTPSLRVSKLIEHFVVDRLASYGGNLKAVVEAIEKDFIPAADAPGVAEWCEVLRNFLANENYPVQDDFMLRYALTVPGRQRGKYPPIIVLDPDRGGFGIKRQRESVGQIERLNEAFVLGRILFPDLLTDSRVAVLQLAERCEKSLCYTDAGHLRRFMELSQEESAELATAALQLLDSPAKEVQNLGTELLEDLVNFRAHEPLTEAVQRELLRREIHYPATLFREAGEEVTAELIKRIETTPDGTLFTALAWTRHELAVDAFRKWQTEPPAWLAKRRSSTAFHLMDAGWAIDTAGNVRTLINESCFRLPNCDPATKPAISCREFAEQTCASCGERMDWLFDFTNLDSKQLEQLFGGAFQNAPRRVLNCCGCAYFGETLYWRYAADGTAECLPVPEEERRESETEYEWTTYTRTPSEAPVSPYHAVRAFRMHDSTTLGGFPSWVQGGYYPPCCECGETMTFLAQHNNNRGEEGTFYVFFCGVCRIGTVSYQQT